MIRIAKQIAVFLDNRPGTLARVCEALQAADVNILALSILDTMDYAIVRMIVDKPEQAEAVFGKLQLTPQVRDVVFMDVPNEVGVLGRIAQQLAEAGINLEYAYCTASPGQKVGGLVVRTNDLEATISALS